MMKRKLVLAALIISLCSSIMVGCGNSKVSKVNEEESQTNLLEEKNTEENENSDKEEDAEEIASANKDTEDIKDDEEIVDEDKDEENDAEQIAGNTVALPTPKVDAETLLQTAYPSSDEYYDFKLDFTEDYLNKVNTVFSFLDEKYTPETDDDTEIYVREDRAQFKYRREVEDYDNRYKYIKQVSITVGFENASDDLYAWQNLNLVLCDEDKDGKIEINESTETILKTIYPNLDMAKVEENIAFAIKQQEAGTYERNVIETGEKYYGNITFNGYKYEDNPVEVTIDLDWYQDYK